jgi:CRISPR-associated endonuclease/helicase Cas3
MSLNISADLLVTERCPLPALIQRLGRLNRWTEVDDPKPCLVYPFEGKPYDSDEACEQMKSADELIDDLRGGPCRQTDLAVALTKMDTDAEPLESSAWLDGGWQSEPRAAREGDASITVIRGEDMGEIVDKLGPEPRHGWPARELVPWTIPMRYRAGERWERRAGGYPVTRVGAINYDNQGGATWAK